MPKKIRLVILDDHQAIIDGYLYRLRDMPDIEVVAMLLYGQDLDAVMASNPVDLLLLDLQVPISPANPNPFPIHFEIPRLLQIYPELTILVISMHAQPALIQSVMETGVSGYILKDDVSTFRDLPTVIRSVANQDIYLSPAAVQAIAARQPDELAKSLSNRQFEALSLCVAFPDLSTAELAHKMDIAHSTLRNLLSGAYLRLGVRTRASAILKAKQMGLFPSPPDRQDFDISDE